MKNWSFLLPVFVLASVAAAAEPKLVVTTVLGSAVHTWALEEEQGRSVLTLNRGDAGDYRIGLRAADAAKLLQAAAELPHVAILPKSCADDQIRVELFPADGKTRATCLSQKTAFSKRYHDFVEFLRLLPMAAEPAAPQPAAPQPAAPPKKR